MDSVYSHLFSFKYLFHAKMKTTVKKFTYLYIS